jgi:hypothetical protein
MTNIGHKYPQLQEHYTLGKESKVFEICSDFGQGLMAMCSAVGCKGFGYKKADTGTLEWIKSKATIMGVYLNPVNMLVPPAKASHIIATSDAFSDSHHKMLLSKQLNRITWKMLIWDYNEHDTKATVDNAMYMGTF